MYDLKAEQIVGLYAVRYKNLVNIINTEYAGSGADKINLFIDMADIFKNISEKCANTTTQDIVSSVINLCAHYRNFFNQYYHTHTYIYLIYSDINNKSLNQMYIPEYKRKIASYEAVETRVLAAMNLIEMITQYIEDINFFNTTYEFGVFVHDIITTECSNGNNRPGIILTKDVYNYQLASSDCLVKILRPKKYKSEDISYMVSAVNAINAYCIYRNVSQEGSFGLNVELLPLVFSLTRLPERNLKSLHSIPSVLKSINKAISSGSILNGYSMDIEYICGKLCENGLKINNSFIVEQRFKAVDIESQYLAFISTPNVRYQGMINLYDPVALKELNMQYFKDNPLDLEVL